MTLKLANIVPADFDSDEVRVRRANAYRGCLQLVWESDDGLVDITIKDCEMDVSWKNEMPREAQSDHVLQATAAGIPADLQQSVARQLHQAAVFREDDDYGGEYLLSMCMPSNQDLDDVAPFQMQTMLHRVKETPMDRLVEFMEEISNAKKNVPVYELIEPPIQTPCLEEMSPLQLTAKLQEIKHRLLDVGIEFKTCQHFDDAHTYDWLIHHIIAWEQVHPQLNEFKMRRCFDTALWCDPCNIDE